MKTRRSSSPHWSLVGIPDHQGVMNVGGRLGAALGPQAFRKAWGRFTGRENLDQTLFDFGDLEAISTDIATNHAAAADLIAKAHKQAGISVIIGGGQDHAYSHLVGIKLALDRPKKKIRIGCVNIDAHFDVRKPNPEITSGSPFYLALESSIIDASRFIELGIQNQCNNSQLWNYIRQQKIHTVLFETLRNGKAAASFRTQLAKLKKCSDAIVVSPGPGRIAVNEDQSVFTPQFLQVRGNSWNKGSLLVF